MENAFNFKTLLEFVEAFKDESACVKHFTETRFQNGVYCPYCKCNHVYIFKGGKRYRCADCSRDFTIKTGTLFGDSKLPIRKWYIAMYLVLFSGKGVSSVKLAQHIGVTQKTAWFMKHRLRTAMKQSDTPLVGTSECDETWIGGKSKNMHAARRRKVITGTGGSGKTPVFGIRTRLGQVRAQVIPCVESSSVHPIIKQHIAKDSALYTDEHRAYYNLQNDYKRGIVRHGLKEYVVGDCHTNGIESFWAVLKRGYHGVYHWMSVKHLQRYVNEFVFRANHRLTALCGVFSLLVENVTQNPQLTYKELTYEPA